MKELPERSKIRHRARLTGPQRGSETVGMTWIVWMLFAFAGASEKITEADLAVCEKDDDCIVVPYQHCCGQTKRAIHRRHHELYLRTPMWRKFNDPEVCAVMGACPSDSLLTKARCERFGGQAAAKAPADGAKAVSKRCVLAGK